MISDKQPKNASQGIRDQSKNKPSSKGSGGKEITNIGAEINKIE